MDSFEALHIPAPGSVQIGGLQAMPGSRVRLRPRPGGDVADLTLRDRSATIESIEATLDGSIHVAVTLDDDPGSDLGMVRLPGHRFFFSPDELELLETAEVQSRILIAGIGNIFRGDDGFGVAVARALVRYPLPVGVTITDFGIRALDLAFTLQQDFDLVVLVDAVKRGSAPGTLHTIVPDIEESVPAPNAHDLDPASVLRLARWLGHLPERVILVGCEPENTDPREFGDNLLDLTPRVSDAVDRAADLLIQLITTFQRKQELTHEPPTRDPGHA